LLAAGFLPGVLMLESQRRQKRNPTVSNSSATGENEMLRPFLIYTRIAVLASCGLPLAMWLFNLLRTYNHYEESASGWQLAFKLIAILVICVPVCLAMIKLPRWMMAAV